MPEDSHWQFASFFDNDSGSAILQWNSLASKPQTVANFYDFTSNTIFLEIKQQYVNNIKILTVKSTYFEICRLFHLHLSNVWFNCYSKNTGLLKTKWGILLQGFKFFEIKFALLTTQNW